MEKTRSEAKETLALWRHNAVKERSFQDWNEDEWTDNMYKDEGDVYQYQARNRDLENDEISNWEAAFMEGYDMAV